MGGHEVATRLKEVPSLKNTPIAFLTDVVSNEETHGIEARIDGHDYLAKPVDLNILIRVIEGHLE